MHKQHAHGVLTRLQDVKPAYLVAATLVSGCVCVGALRANNEHMLKLRDAVYTADRNNSDIQTPLKKLQAYVTHHMNTNLSAGPNAVYPPIQLKYTYDRLVQAEGTRLSSTNTKLYNDAQHYCEQQDPVDFSGRNRVPCIEQYVQSHNPGALPAIPDALYKFDFVSPRWSPDLAGWSLLAALLLAALTLVSFVAGVIRKRLLRHN